MLRLFNILPCISLYFEQTHLHVWAPCAYIIWSAPRIATSGPVQQHFGFEWLWKHNRLRTDPIRFVRLDSEHAESDGKSVNRGLPVFDQARGWARRSRFLVLNKRSAASGDENGSSSNSSVLDLYLRTSDMMHCDLRFKYHDFSRLVVSSVRWSRGESFALFLTATCPL